jgi:hypothetical protein
MTMDGDVPMGVVMAVVVGVGTWHKNMLYYNITGVHQRRCGLDRGVTGGVTNAFTYDNSDSPPSAKRWGGVGGGGCLSKFAARGASRTRCRMSKPIDPPPRPLPATREERVEGGERMTPLSRRVVSREVCHFVPPSPN